MHKIRYGIIGLGNMGNSHCKSILNGKVENSILAAVCDKNEEILNKFKTDNPDIPAYLDYKELISSGKVDAVIIATYHYSHPQIAIDAFKANIHVLTEKPAGVYTNQVEDMNKAAKESGKVFAIMYNQRVLPYFQKVRDLYQSGELGTLKRVSWIITTWYRPQAYHDSSTWRSTWKDEGGGALINQCPHQLDLWQWILGMPKTVWATMGFGKYYDIEVEDDVTAFMEYENGATGTFITSTSEFPGTNRLEIVGSRGKIVCEDKKIHFSRTRIDERDFNKTNTKPFGGPETWEIDVPFNETLNFEETMHIEIIKNFSSSIINKTPLIAPGEEGLMGLTLSNAMHLSAFTGEKITLPIDGDRFYNVLQNKIDTSVYIKKQVKEQTTDLRGTF